MHIVVTGATGNLGTACLDQLVAEPAITRITAIARREPELRLPKTEFISLDVAKDDLTAVFETVDAVVHLAWVLQSSHDEDALARTNVVGTERVARAAARAGVEKLVYASSVGAYAPGDGPLVDETWPTTGIPTSTYSMQKVAVERMLDGLEEEFPDLHVVRLRPALVFQRDAGDEIRKLFGGPLVPRALMKPGRIPFVPRGVDLQCVHASDVGDAIRLALVRPARGAFNLAAEPVLDSRMLARLLHAKTIAIPQTVLRTLAAAAFALRLSPSEPGWIDLAFQAPKLSTKRAHDVLGWRPRHSASDALLELLAGMRDKATAPTPPLSVGPSTA